MHGFNGLFSIRNMGVDTYITALLAIKAKILEKYWNLGEINGGHFESWRQ